MQLRSIEDLKSAGADELKEALSNVQVISRLEAYLEDINLKPSGRKLCVFSASELGSKGGISPCGNYPMGCARMLYYRYIGEPPESRIDPRLRRIFDTGHAVHGQLQGYLGKLAKELGDVFVDEATFNEDTSPVAAQYEIDSTTDGIYSVKTPNLDLRFGIEIKTMKAELFKGLNKPSPENVIQSHVYMACLDLPAMTIVYYNKNDSTMMEFLIPFQQEIWDSIAEKIVYVRKCAVDEKPPEREAGYHCNTCRYKHVCKPPKPGKKNVKKGKSRFTLRGVR